MELIAPLVLLYQLIVQLVQCVLLLLPVTLPVLQDSILLASKQSVVHVLMVSIVLNLVSLQYFVPLVITLMDLVKLVVYNVRLEVIVLELFLHQLKLYHQELIVLLG